VLVWLETGDEPTGQEMSDLLSVDKVTQYVFIRLWSEITSVSNELERRHMQSLGLVAAA
jgi:hypothetical protein